MYIRQDSRRGKSISIPHNYSGNAFSAQDTDDIHQLASPDCEISNESNEVKESTEVCHCAEEKQKFFLPINIGTEELLLIGLIILMFQSGSEDNLTPLLLILLLFGGN